MPRSPRQLRSAREIAAMRQAGLLVWQTFHNVIAPLIRPGVSTGEIDDAVARHFAAHRAEPLFLNFPNATPGGVPFPAVTCISLDAEVVHGIPSPRRKLAEGDIVSIDTGCKLRGWCGDAAVTFPVGTIDPLKQKLLQVTKGVLLLAIDLMGKKTWWNEVAAEMEKFVRAHKFSVVEDFVGHSIGREMHEDLQVPNYVPRRVPRNPNFRLEEGLVIAVEPMVNVGAKTVKTLADDWTVVTKDGKPSAHFEHTIAMTSNGPAVLTAGPNGEL
ncbi:MAG: type I methionyl aminopeptidase [Pirellulales bacterium]|nr:type I methionyl aminopeptidase [Pirellulales bacterium]